VSILTKPASRAASRLSQDPKPTKPAGHSGRTARPAIFVFLLPAGIILGVFSIGAIVFNIVLSLGDRRGEFGDGIGPANYLAVLQDGAFLKSLFITAYMVLGSVPISIVLAILIAYSLYFRMQRSSFYRLVLFFPYVFPTVAVGMVWGLIFGPSPDALANWTLGLFGLEAQNWLHNPTGIFTMLAEPTGLELPDWLGGPSVTMLAVIFVRIWQMLGFSVVILMGGFTQIDTELLDAAKVDGAGERRTLYSVIIPLLKPTLVFLTVISVIYGLREFNLIYVLTNGGPIGTTETLTMLVFRQFYENNAIGLGAATATLLMALILTITLAQFWLTREEKE
jgi:ABC-type sugar transport system permease subunit